MDTKDQIDKLLKYFPPKNWINSFIWVKTLVITALGVIIVSTLFFEKALYEAGSIGDLVNGLLGPVIAMMAVGVTFLAFLIQYEANKIQRDQIKVEQFESNYFELLKIHRENRSAIVIGSGRKKVVSEKAFVELFKELKYAYLLVEMAHGSALELKQIQKSFDLKDLSNIAYVMFFVGVGNLSDSLIKRMLSNYPEVLLEICISLFKTTQRNYREGKEAQILIDNQTEGGVFLHDFKYAPFQGHLSKLGHYFRHLFQLVNYIDGNKDLKNHEKYNYVKTLRSQLSSYEQLILYYNALSIYGEKWISEGIIQRYCIVKNIPLPLADFGRLPLTELGATNDDGRAMFEWSEIAP